MKQLEEKVDRLEKGDDNNNIKMEKDFQAALQYDRLNSIVVSGIPQNISDELLENKAINILYTVNTTKINHRDIEACHRLGRKKETLIKFVNRKDAEQSIENRTKLANFNRVEPGFDPNVPIYINQHLTPFISKLAFYGRCLKRNGHIHAMSSLKGVIKIKLESHSSWIRIGHTCDFYNLFPNLREIINISD